MPNIFRKTWKVLQASLPGSRCDICRELLYVSPGQVVFRHKRCKKKEPQPDKCADCGAPIRAEEEKYCTGCLAGRLGV